MKNIIKLYEIPLLEQDIVFAYVKDTKGLFDTITTHKETADFYKENQVSFDRAEFEYDPYDCAFVATDNKNGKPVAIVFVHAHFDLGTLVHETNHLVFYLARYCGFDKELEFQAYLHEKIFNDLRSLTGK